MNVLLEGEIIAVDNIGDMEIRISHSGPEDMRDTITVNLYERDEESLMIPDREHMRLLGQTCFLAGKLEREDGDIRVIRFEGANGDCLRMRVKESDIPSPDHVGDVMFDGHVAADIKITNRDIRAFIEKTSASAEREVVERTGGILAGTLGEAIGDALGDALLQGMRNAPGM